GGCLRLRVPLEGEGLLASLRVPQPDRSVPAAAGQALAVVAERHEADPAGLSLEGEGLLVSLRVPHRHRLAIAPRGQTLAIGAERKAAEHAGVPLKGSASTLYLSCPVIPLKAA